MKRYIWHMKQFPIKFLAFCFFNCIQREISISIKTRSWKCRQFFIEPRKNCAATKIPKNSVEQSVKQIYTVKKERLIRSMDVKNLKGPISGEWKHEGLRCATTQMHSVLSSQQLPVSRFLVAFRDSSQIGTKSAAAPRAIHPSHGTNGKNFSRIIPFGPGQCEQGSKEVQVTPRQSD